MNYENTSRATCPTCGKHIAIIDGKLVDHPPLVIHFQHRVCPSSGTPATAGGNDTFTCPTHGPRYETFCTICAEERTLKRLAPSPAAPAGDVRDDEGIWRFTGTDHGMVKDHEDGEWVRLSYHGRTVDALRRQHTHDAEEITKLRARLKAAEPYLPAEFRAALKREEEGK